MTPAWCVALSHGVTGHHRHWRRSTCLWGGGCPVVIRGHWQIAAAFAVFIAAAFCALAVYR